MYPGTIFNWHDNSGINPPTTSEQSNSPLMLQIFSADKGTEDLIKISGADFNAMYGTMNFDRHGQSAIQAQNIINAGGTLLAKRVVANDSTLANIVLSATVVEKTITVGEETKTVAQVTWSATSVTNAKTFDEVKEQVLENFDETTKVFPLFVITDNGRGVSNKSVRFIPDYATSKGIGSTFYTLAIYEGRTIPEQVTVTLDPSVIYGNVAYRLDQYTNVQISGEVIDTVYNKYLECLSDIMAIEESELRKYDIIYGYTNNGTALPNFVLGETSIDLDSEKGIALLNGSNGSFGDNPIGTTAWSQAIVKVFEDCDEIYNVDTYKIAAVCDANYPMDVKNAIYDFVAFRKDCVFLRDYGTDLTTFQEIEAKRMDFADRRNYFTADYSTSYLISDPNSMKPVRVTCMYDIAALMVNHLANNPYAPLAGTANGFVLKSAIKGSLNYVPVNTPKANQLQAMDNIRVNYAVFEDNNCVVQSNYTSQEEYTQLSYICNVIGVQTVLRAVRTVCPRQRFSLSTSNDLQAYATVVNSVLSNFAQHFETLNFIYTQDKLRASQKIFFASLEFSFLGWAQTEIFDVFALNNN